MKIDNAAFRPISITISESIGNVSALLHEPTEMKCILTLAHGAGAGMTHKFMEELAVELGKNKIGTLRYNFPYMEQGRKMPDVPAIATKTVHKVIQTAHELFPTIPLLAGGKSFGGRMTSQLLSKEDIAFVKGIVFFGFPLHPAGKPSIDRAAHLKDVKKPMLFLQGTKDTLADASLISNVCSELPTATLKWLEKADHAFHVPKQNLIPELALLTRKWFESF
ncbi:MAG TPA: alpha/beta family hydrolase [Cyclobacteriaceae bacterium]